MTEELSWATKIWRGMKLRCPSCGDAPLFKRYLRPVEQCGNCDEKFGHIRADDAPPYLTLLISGHIVIPLALAHLQWSHPPLWVMFAVWIPVLMATILLMLPCMKGAVLALMWHLGISGNEHS